VAERLAALHASPELARAMGDDGMRRAYQHFTWRSVARQAAAIYESAVVQATAPTR
jgi:D-inositol-3-phosphate glycosyltransferase